jgi:hypothetical protein
MRVLVLVPTRGEQYHGQLRGSRAFFAQSSRQRVSKELDGLRRALFRSFQQTIIQQEQRRPRVPHLRQGALRLHQCGTAGGREVDRHQMTHKGSL